MLAATLSYNISQHSESHSPRYAQKSTFFCSFFKVKLPEPNFICYMPLRRIQISSQNIDRLRRLCCSTLPSSHFPRYRSLLPSRMLKSTHRKLAATLLSINSSKRPAPQTATTKLVLPSTHSKRASTSTSTSHKEHLEGWFSHYEHSHFGTLPSFWRRLLQHFSHTQEGIVPAKRECCKCPLACDELDLPRPGNKVSNIMVSIHQNSTL